MADSRIIRSGVGAGIIALLASSVLGGFGGWNPVVSLANNQFGGWLIVTLLSVVMSYIFGYFFHDFLPGTATIRGAIFGVLVWILLLVLGGVSAYFNEAVYPNPAGTSLFLSLLLHLAWGGTLGLLYESKS